MVLVTAAGDAGDGISWVYASSMTGREGAKGYHDTEHDCTTRPLPPPPPHQQRQQERQKRNNFRH